jgi:Domain of unknown function (DUF1836)
MIKSHFPPRDQIPTINLYMDQLLEYLDQFLASEKRSNDEIALTKTMINNYVKSKMVVPPDRKKYNQESIIDLLIIHHYKRAFTIQDTGNLLQLMKHESDYYTGFRTRHEELINTLPELDFTNLDPVTAKALLLQLAEEVAIKKQLTEQLLDFLKASSI